MTECLSAAATIAVLATLRLRPTPRLRSVDRSSTAHRRRGWRRRPRLRPDELATWCDALARDIRSGATLGAALRTIDPPPASRLGQIARRLQRGVPLDGAVVVATGSVHEHAVTAVLGALARSGGPAAQPLDRLAATLRRRAADDAERAAHSAQARLSAIVMTMLPGAVLVLLVATSAPVRFALSRPVGIAVLAVGIALNALGWFWMRRLIRGERR